MANMPINLYFGPLRVVLGDRQVHGLWNYSDETLAQAISAVFFLNRGPDGFVLVPSTGGNNASSSINQEVAPNPMVAGGDFAAWITYEAALLALTGEDGAFMMKSRVLWVRDFGERKRDLLSELRMLIYRIKDGDAVFTTSQSFVAFLGNMPASGNNNVLGPIAEFSSISFQTGIQELTV
jgi:hypothetical protein